MRISDWSSDVCSSDLPNGSLHLGHAFSAIAAHDLARERGGRFLLRIKDIDGARSRPELAAEFREDLGWLGLEYEEVPPQSTRLAAYAAAAERLRALGLLYPCQCSRTDILAANPRSEEHTSELQSLMRISYAVFCLK